ncbi:MAG: zinc-binding dehydrogenase [Thermomicrobiales bacterium]
MTTIITFTGPKQVGFIEEPSRDVEAGEVRLRTLYSGISAGTELTAYRGTNPYLHKAWDAGRRLFIPAAGDLPSSHSWGYEEVGEVVELGSGVDASLSGRIVFGTWGHRTEHVAEASWARERTLPSDTDPLLGVFSQIGAIALNGILDGAIRLGETVAVFGLGVVGQLIARLACLSGATVIGVDPLPARRELAKDAIEATIDAEGAAEVIRDRTRGLGADVVFEASGSARALHEAVRACAPSSRVVALGFYQGEASGLLLGEEFHHNRINIVGSRISGVAPELRHRWDRARLVRTFMDLAVRGEVNPLPLITHVRPAAEAASLYEELDQRPAGALQAVLDFRGGVNVSGANNA